MVTQWRDKKDVTLLSSCVNDSTINVTRAGKEKTIPLVVNFYNANMGGVDKSDQMLTSYEVERKRVKKWYKKSFPPPHKSISFQCPNYTQDHCTVCPDLEKTQISFLSMCRRNVIFLKVHKNPESMQKKLSKNINLLQF